MDERKDNIDIVIIVLLSVHILVSLLGSGSPMFRNYFKFKGISVLWIVSLLVCATCLGLFVSNNFNNKKAVTDAGDGS